MDNKLKTLLYDILNAIEEIDSFFTQDSKHFDDYKRDVKTRERWKEILK